MNNLGKVVLMSLALTFAAGEVLAQKTPSRRTVPKPKDQRQAIQQQTRGQYPDFQRGAQLPKGAINFNWATKCKPNESTRSFLYQPGVEIRVRARQLIGTVLRFPEKVTPITSGLGNALTLEKYPKNANGASQLWVLGARHAGLDGNLAFIGGEDLAGPRIYSLRVQTEGVNTENCPDLVINIRSHTDPALTSVARRIAGAIEAEAGRVPLGAAAPVPPADPKPAVTKAPLSAVADMAASTEGTGRQDVDWLEGFKFDPAKLDFKWTIGGDEGGQSFAPDAVYSDDEFMYLHWRPERMKQMILPAISAVIPTDRGKVDGPVTWVRRGNTVIVQRITPLTLEFEGLVVCIVREDEAGEK